MRAAGCGCAIPLASAGWRGYSAAMPTHMPEARPVSKPHSLLETVLGSFVAPHPDGYKFIAIAGALALGFFIIDWRLLALLMTLVTAWVIYFFRDPDRVAPLRDGLVVSAADGVVSAIETVKPPAELGLGDIERVRISTFLSVFDVHVNRAPIAGRIKRSVYTPGAFVNAALDKASEENERRTLVIETPQGVEIGVVQIAGMVARRIVTFATEGENVGVGQRFGLIRFGSRVDVYLPPKRAALVAVGQRMIGGETVLADLKSDEAAREARRV
jgi:phosphatidylserine decarboxylase